MSTSFAYGIRRVRAFGDELFAAAFAVAWLSGVVSGGVPSGHWHLTVFAVCGLLITVPLSWRRTAPVLVALLVFAGATALAFLQSADLPIGVIVATLVASYSLGGYVGGRWSWVTLAVVLGAITVANVPHNDAGVAGVILTPTVFVLVPWAGGRLVARLRNERGALRRLTYQLEREQLEVAQASVLQERARIARELHDIVAHSISVMVVQAGAAEQFVDPTSRGRAPLEAIRTTGQEALVEMRRLVGILRTDDRAQLSLAPQPGLGSLDALVDAARSSGLEVTIDVRGEPEPLSPGMDVAAYRLVQESFSNIRKHARARSAAVTLRYEPACLWIAVTDDGIGGRPGPTVDGHGLIGMRERVGLYGGRLSCGPRPEGGWQVLAQLPMRG